MRKAAREWVTVYCYYEDALIDTDDKALHFLDSDDECDSERILVESY